MTIGSEEAQGVLSELKKQIRSRENPLDRSEYWEGYEVDKGVYENAPNLEGHTYSFDKERRILMSRISPDERKDLGWL